MNAKLDAPLKRVWDKEKDLCPVFNLASNFSSFIFFLIYVRINSKQNDNPVGLSNAVHVQGIPVISITNDGVSFGAR